MNDQETVISLVPLGGRYPYGLTRYARESIRAKLHLVGDEVRLRIDDLEQIDRWEEFAVPRERLLELL